MQIIQAPNSEAQTLAEIFGTERRIKLWPIGIEIIPQMLRFLSEGRTMSSDDFPPNWDTLAWLVLKEYPDKIFFVIESPAFELVTRYVPDSNLPLFEPRFYQVDSDNEEQ